MTRLLAALTAGIVLLVLLVAPSRWNLTSPQVAFADPTPSGAALPFPANYNFDAAGTGGEVVKSWTATGGGSLQLLTDVNVGNYVEMGPNGSVNLTGTSVRRPSSTATTIYSITYQLHPYMSGNSNVGSAFQLYWDSDTAGSWVVYQDGAYTETGWKTGEFPIYSFEGVTGKFRLHFLIGIPDIANVGGNQANYFAYPADADGPQGAGPQAPNRTHDPILVTSGAYQQEHTDIAIPGRGAGLEFTRRYNSQSSYVGTLGHRWIHNYAASVSLALYGDANVRYPSGRLVRFRLAGSTYTPPAGVFDTLVKNGDNTWQLTTKEQLRYQFDATGNLTAILDRNNNTTTVNWASGQIASVSSPAGTLTFAYSGDRISQVSDSLGRSVAYGYDVNGDLTTITDVSQGQTVYTYDSHRLATGTDSLQHTFVTNTYDDANRVSQQVGALPSMVTTVAYDTPGVGATTVTDARNNPVIYYFDTSYRTTDIKDPLANFVHYDYDGSNNVSCLTDPRSNKTSFSYDAKGNVTQVIDANNTTSTCTLKVGGVLWAFTYNSSNDLLTATDPLDHQTEYRYDSIGNLTRIMGRDTNAQGRAVRMLTCFELDANGQPTAYVQSTDLVVPPGATDPCTGNKTKFEYDTAGNVAAVVNPRFSSQPTPPETTFSYDLGGRRLTATNELGHVTTDTYDPRNDVLTIKDNLNNTSSNTYNTKGVVTTVTDAKRQAVGAPETGAACGTAGTGNGVDDDGDGVKDDGCPSAIYSYDAADRLTQVTDALGQTTSYAYDAAGNRTAVTNAKRQAVGAPETGAACGTAGTGNGVDDDGDGVKDDGCPSSVLAYDALNRLQSQLDALGRSTTYQYDATSNVTQRTDARGLVTKYFYDPANQMTRLEHWNGATLVDSVDYTYDAAGNRKTMADPTGTTSYVYDALNRLTSVTFPGPKTVSYLYDNAGNRSRITYADNKVVNYTYDEAQDMKTVTDWLNKQTVYTYDNAGNLTKSQFPNSTWTDFTHDNADRLTVVGNKKTGSTISSFTYTLDAVGNRSQMVALSGTTSYGYDALYRLTQVIYPGPSTTNYTYDANGNRQTMQVGSTTTTYTYDAADEMNTAGAVAYLYDANGNQTNRGANTFTYDHENRLTKSVIGSATSTSIYNGDGLRVSHKVGSKTTSYTWDVARGMPVLLQDGTNTYVYGLDLISSTKGTTQTYFLNDGLGSTANLTSSTGSTSVTYTYDAFGAIKSQTGSSTNFWLFTGEQRDSDTSLYFLRARYYDPATGRFLAQDPLRGSAMHPGTQNRYAYVGNNPVNFVDPTGLAQIGIDGGGGKEGRSMTLRYDLNSSGKHCIGTIELSTSVQGQAYGAAGEIGVGAGVDDELDVGILGYGGAGGGPAFPPLGASWNIVNVSVTNADCLSARGGAGATIGGCAALGLSVCIAFVSGSGYGGFQFGAGIGTPRLQFFGMGTVTGVLTTTANGAIGAVGNVIDDINPF